MLNFDTINNLQDDLLVDMTYRAKVGQAQKSNPKSIRVDSLYRSTDYETTSSAASQAPRRGSTATTFVNTPKAGSTSGGNPFSQKQVHEMYLRLLSL